MGQRFTDILNFFFLFFCATKHLELALLTRHLTHTLMKNQIQNSAVWKDKLICIGELEEY